MVSETKTEERNASSVTWRFWADEEDSEGVETVEFKLIYRGRLPAASRSSTRAKEKHQIRKQFHKQLKQLWLIHPPMSRWMTQPVSHLNSPTGKDTTVLEVIADQYARLGYRFVPLITEAHSLGAELDILFLRRDAPGKVVSSSGGDLDNRIKVLFDAFRIPAFEPEVAGFSVEADENPFFVLLEDDSLISKVTIGTDRLLTPQEDNESANDVHLIIGVKVKVVTVDKHLGNLQFL